MRERRTQVRFVFLRGLLWGIDWDVREQGREGREGILIINPIIEPKLVLRLNIELKKVRGNQ
jgi:hypothetical protein